MCGCVHVCECLIEGGGGVLMHLKFHNICSIGSSIYTTEAGVPL